MGELDDQLRRLAERRAERTPETAAGSAVAVRSSANVHRRWWAAAAAALILLAAGGAWLAARTNDNIADVVATSTTTDPQQSAQRLQTIVAADYGVKVNAPPEWDEIESGRTWGDSSGFLSIDVAPGDTLTGSALEIASGATDVLGPDPTYDNVRVAGQRAVRITGTKLATSDLGTGVHVVTVIEAPAPVTVNGETEQNILVATDVDHHDEILRSLEWITLEPAGLSADADYSLAAASAAGIQLREGATDSVLQFAPLGLTGARIAFVLDGPVLVYESAASGAPTSHIAVATISSHEIVLDGNVRLLDAAMVDGEPAALISRRTSEVPDAVNETLILVNLTTMAETELGLFGDEEAEIGDARLGDGAIVLQLRADGLTWEQAITYAGGSLWATEAVDKPGALALDRSYVYLVDLSRTDDRGFVARWDVIDLVTGSHLGEFDRTFGPDMVEVTDEPSCLRPEWRVFLFCNNGPEGTAYQVDVEIGTIHPVPGIGPGLVTRTNAVSATAPEQHPCGPGHAYFTGPDDILSSTSILLDDGRTMEVLVWNENDRVIVQGLLPDWSTNRLDVGLYIHEYASRITVTPASESNKGFPSPLEGAFTIFLPDSVYTETTLTGYATWIEFDGCDLAAGVSGVIN